MVTKISQPVEEKKSSNQASSRDSMLQAIVAVPERTQLELGITLNVKGLLITGFIISQKTYFDTLIEGVNSTEVDSETRSSLSGFFAELKDSILDKAADQEKIIPQFIHLRDVKIYPSEGKGMPTYGNALWRGRLSSIDGFSLGEMVPARFESITGQS